MRRFLILMLIAVVIVGGGVWLFRNYSRLRQGQPPLISPRERPIAPYANRLDPPTPTASAAAAFLTPRPQ